MSKERKSIKEELKAVKIANRILLMKLEMVRNELRIESELNQDAVEGWMDAIKVIEKRNSDIEVFKLMLGLPTNPKKPF